MSGEPNSKRPRDRILSGESRWNASARVMNFCPSVVLTLSPLISRPVWARKRMTPPTMFRPKTRTLFLLCELDFFVTLDFDLTLTSSVVWAWVASVDPCMKSSTRHTSASSSLAGLLSTGNPVHYPKSGWSQAFSPFFQ